MATDCDTETITDIKLLSCLIKYHAEKSLVKWKYSFTHFNA
jgi:hypothetical protein